MSGYQRPHDAPIYPQPPSLLNDCDPGLREFRDTYQPDLEGLRYDDLNVASGLNAIKAATVVKLKLINTAVPDWAPEDAFREIYANWYVHPPWPSCLMRNSADLALGGMVCCDLLM